MADHPDGDTRVIVVGDLVEVCGLSSVAQNGLRGRVEECGKEVKVKLGSGEILSFRASDLKRVEASMGLSSSSSSSNSSSSKLPPPVADSGSKFSFRRSKPPPPPMDKNHSHSASSRFLGKKESILSYWVTVLSPSDPASPEDTDVQKGYLELNVSHLRLSLTTISGRERIVAEFPVTQCSLLNEQGRYDVSSIDAVEDEKQLFEGLAEEILRIKLPIPTRSKMFVFEDDASLAHFLKAWPGVKEKNPIARELAPSPATLAPKGLAPDTKGVKLDEAEQKAVSSTHHAFELTYDMMLGIRTTVSKTEAKTRSDLTMQDMVTTTRLKFPSKGSRSTPAHGMSDFYFKDYAPEVFRRIRGLAGIDPGNYLNEICGDFQFLEFQSNSKSGEFFFFSHNRHYMIKTISHPETMILQTMLASYYVHLQNNHDSLLTQFYGMHKVRPANQTKPYYFLIMKSIFHTDLPIHAIFDLKGSTLGRSASKEDKERGECVFKDNDFLEQSIALQLGPERAKRLVSAAEKDVALLRDMNIMDYSLLIGIHYSPKHPKNKGNQRRSISVNQLSQMRTTTAVDDDESEGFEEHERNRTPTIVRGSIRPVDLGFSKLSLPELPVGTVLTTSTASMTPVEGDHEDPNSASGGDTETKSFSTPEDFKEPTGNKKEPKEDSAAFLAARNYRNQQSKPEKKSARQVKAEATVVTPKTDTTVIKSIWQAADGGCAGSGFPGEHEVYFFGIIDILVEYGIKKKMETKFKSMKHEKSAISSVEPLYYSNRFTQFVKSNVVHMRDMA